MFLTYDSNHRWIWFKGQKVNEAILFLSFDTHPQNNVHSECSLLGLQLDQFIFGLTILALQSMLSFLLRFDQSRRRNSW
jgi:hypothetical protein